MKNLKTSSISIVLLLTIGVVFGQPGGWMGNDSTDFGGWGDFTPCVELTAEECASNDLCELDDAGECSFSGVDGITLCVDMTADECALNEYCELDDAGECAFVGGWMGNDSTGFGGWGGFQTCADLDTEMCETSPFCELDADGVCVEAEFEGE